VEDRLLKLTALTKAYIALPVASVDVDCSFFEVWIGPLSAASESVNSQFESILFCVLQSVASSDLTKVTAVKLQTIRLPVLILLNFYWLVSECYGSSWVETLKWHIPPPVFLSCLCNWGNLCQCKMPWIRCVEINILLSMGMVWPWLMLYVDLWLVAAVDMEEAPAVLTFDDWLASVTEHINQTMHYQFDGACVYTVKLFLCCSLSHCHTTCVIISCLVQNKRSK